MATWQNNDEYRLNYNKFYQGRIEKLKDIFRNRFSFFVVLLLSSAISSLSSQTRVGQFIC